MKLCGKDCIPCCDFCIYASHDEIVYPDGRVLRGGPDGCNLHKDEEHDYIAIGCGYCDDFYCFNCGDKDE